MGGDFRIRVTSLNAAFGCRLMHPGGGGPNAAQRSEVCGGLKFDAAPAGFGGAARFGVREDGRSARFGQFLTLA